MPSASHQCMYHYIHVFVFMFTCASSPLCVYACIDISHTMISRSCTTSQVACLIQTWQVTADACLIFTWQITADTCLILTWQVTADACLILIWQVTADACVIQSWHVSAVCAHAYTILHTLFAHRSSRPKPAVAEEWWAGRASLACCLMVSVLRPGGASAEARPA